MKRLPTLLTAALLLLTTANAKAQVSAHIDSLLFENSHRIDSAGACSI
jgi:putative cell wall-binding protein